jgi:hypothetical protein
MASRNAFSVIANFGGVPIDHSDKTFVDGSLAGGVFAMILDG